uniref:Uncharacterized protein n=1 Tax=Arundo donax TaxID=35708 RepID=A0A0A9CC50_ARUDO
MFFLSLSLRCGCNQTPSSIWIIFYLLKISLTTARHSSQNSDFASSCFKKKGKEQELIEIERHIENCIIL